MNTVEEQGTILVTGGAGFIGSEVVRQLVGESAARVVNVDKLTYAGNLESLAGVEGNPRYVFEQVDICDPAELERLFAHYRPDAVLHLAAESHVDRSIDGPDAFVMTNVVGTAALLESARRHWRGLPAQAAERFRFVHVSTDEVFGSLGDAGAFTEHSPYQPRSPYSASKAGADHLARAWHHTYGLPVIVTNCSNNYGPYQFPEKLIPLMILNAREGRTLPIYGRGDNVRDWLYVGDHVRALRTVLARGRVGETYNIGGRSERTNRQVVDAICALLDERLPDSLHRPHVQLIEFVADRPGHDHRYAIDCSKMERELGWRPNETFTTGLAATVQWYLDNDAWCRHVQDGSYRRERLGLKEAAS